MYNTTSALRGVSLNSKLSRLKTYENICGSHLSSFDILDSFPDSLSILVCPQMGWSYLGRGSFLLRSRFRMEFENSLDCSMKREQEVGAGA